MAVTQRRHQPLTTRIVDNHLLKHIAAFPCSLDDPLSFSLYRFVAIFFSLGFGAQCAKSRRTSDTLTLRAGEVKQPDQNNARA